MVALPPRSVGLVVVESSTSALLVLSAILGNSLLLVSLYRKPRLKSSTGILIAALAMTDLLNAFIPGALFWSSLTKGKMSLNNFSCQISGFFMHFLTYASMTTMALTAINRYVCVLKPNVSKKAFSYHRSMLYIACLWVFVAVVVFLPIVSGSSTFASNPVMAACAMKFTTRNAEIGYTFFIVAFFVVCCLIIISVCYFRVSRFIRHHNINTTSQLSMQEINLTKALFVLVFTFAALWIPAFLMVVLSRLVLKAKLPRQFVLVVPYVIHLSSALNPWIYGVMCPVVRNKMKKTLFVWKGRGSTVSVGPEITVARSLEPARPTSEITTHVSVLPNVTS
ncbi:melatonin receptor type 1A-like [Orbicella faveolata]|uniref:melatonin receptor type 1A-like n=1 Tax=Orbicella faveolata TaxID=48498 RepID=UPI0009E24FD0|nr:melatonin receptor type 1A-like [Orbicella faveolata]